MNSIDNNVTGDKKEKINLEEEPMITIQFIDTETDVITRTVSILNFRDGYAYSMCKYLATEDMLDMKGTSFSNEQYAGALAERIYEMYLEYEGIAYSHPGYKPSGADKGDFVIEGAVYDIKTSSKYKNVSFKPRTDVKIDYLIGSHIRYNEAQATLQIYGRCDYKKAIASDLNKSKSYVVVEPKNFK